jgi:hypothetical protein
MGRFGIAQSVRRIANVCAAFGVARVGVPATTEVFWRLIHRAGAAR